MESSGGRSEGYRWTCPICETSRVVLSGMSPRTAVDGLYAHLEIYDGAGHAPEGEFPDGVDVDRLEAFVSPLGGDERPAESTGEAADRPE